MEARQEFRGSAISKTFVAIVLVLVAIGLGVMGAFVAKSLSGSNAATQTQSVPAATSSAADEYLIPATDLRQDNDYPVLQSAPEQTRPIRHE